MGKFLSDMESIAVEESGKTFAKAKNYFNFLAVNWQ
jgi:hypothetical protein